MTKGEREREMDGWTHTEAKPERDGMVRGRELCEPEPKPVPAMVQILPPWPNSDSLQEALSATGSE